MKVPEDERENRSIGQDGLQQLSLEHPGESDDGELVWEDVEYDFPAFDSKDIFARQRHIDRMRQREMACIRNLDGEAAIEHRDRKARMTREGQCDLPQPQEQPQPQDQQPHVSRESAIAYLQDLFLNGNMDPETARAVYGDIRTVG